MFGAVSAHATVANHDGGVIYGAHSHWHKQRCDHADVSSFFTVIMRSPCS